MITFQKNINIIASAAVGGKLEAQGPLGAYFDLSSDDNKFEMDTWEKSEAEMVRRCTEVCLKKSGFHESEIDLAFAGDLTNQCAASAFGMKNRSVPYVGLYGACSTFALSLGMSGLSIEAGLAKRTINASSSHFCSAERQYRYPLEYGCQRTPTAQTTVTACGATVCAEEARANIRLKEFLPGIIRDCGITDAANMGAAMAPACADTLVRYFAESKDNPENFDLILTGDLGLEGSRLLREICLQKGLTLGENYKDCGTMIYDLNQQKVDAGGSGCGCSASVFCAYIYSLFKDGRLNDVLLIGTGALLSAGTVLQKETIPAVAHLVRIKKEKI